MYRGGRFITDITSEHTGGNCLADVIRLLNGSLVVIADECLAVYHDAADWYDGGDEPQIIDAGTFQRADDERAPFVFIRDVTVDEPDGPVSTDLLTLNDGRVIGIDAGLLVLYPNRAAFDAITSDDEGATAIADGAPGCELESMMETGCPECARSFGPHYCGPCEH